jgi:transposase
VPGRKTDVSDAAWLCQLAEAGLLRASFVPAKPIRRLRNLTRYRKTQIQERQREVNRLHKALEDAGIKLDCVAADVLGKSGRDMLDALVAGTSDPEVLADLARRQMRKKIPALREALAGHFDAHHRLWVGAILRHTTTSRQCVRTIERVTPISRKSSHQAGIGLFARRPRTVSQSLENRGFLAGGPSD